MVHRSDAYLCYKMNDIGNSLSCGNGSSDSALNSDSKLCRDFMRNVCHRGKNCKFIHAENIKIRNEPIFCHDFQQNRCHRPTCKFIHCSREIEENFKKTGELPDGVYENQNGQGQIGNGDIRNSSSRGSEGNMRNHTNNKPMNRNNGMESNYNSSSSDVPICKDYLKGVCNRLPGSCKYRHINAQQNEVGRVSRNGGGRPINNGNGNGKTLMLRRRGSDGLYDCGPDIKKLRPNETNGFGFGNAEEFNEDFYVGNPNHAVHGQGYSALPPHSEALTLQNSVPPPTSVPDSHAFTQFHQTQPTSTYVAVTGANRNGFTAGGANESTVSAYLQSAETIKALEDENFMLKRRIEELKTSNEFLLNQNAQLRLNSSLGVTRTSVGVENVQVQPAVGVASVANGVVQTMVSMAQPMGITPSLSVAATQPLSTISTLPTVSLPPVSISQALPVVSIAQHQPQPVYPMVTTQGVITQAANLT